MDRLNWAGFYLTHGEELLLGPFQGKPACIHIPWRKGVCGTAAAKKETVIVPDVHEFPGHIACDSASRSEIVVPLVNRNGEVLGVLDIDSPFPARFSEEDAEVLEKLAQLIVTGCDWE
ncbi:MAG: GAF domain-containing protein [Acutalibacter sp.]|nr:GAF domain-containing protein [Acutalibacter sp.]